MTQTGLHGLDIFTMSLKQGCLSVSQLVKLQALIMDFTPLFFVVARVRLTVCVAPVTVFATRASAPAVVNLILSWFSHLIFVFIIESTKTITGAKLSKPTAQTKSVKRLLKSAGEALNLSLS